MAIDELRVSAGVSSTHLTQRFKELIGVTPKRLARTYRFATTVLSINPAGPIDWADLASSAGYFDQAHFGHELPGVHRAHADPSTSKSGGGSYANILATCWIAGRCRSIDFLQDRQLTKR